MVNLPGSRGEWDDLSLEAGDGERLFGVDPTVRGGEVRRGQTGYFLFLSRRRPCDPRPFVATAEKDEPGCEGRYLED